MAAPKESTCWKRSPWPAAYTRIAAPERISIRPAFQLGKDEIVRVDAKRLARGDRGNFTVLPGDAITVGESIF